MKKNLFNRVIAVFIILVMMLPLIPTGVAAVDTGEDLYLYKTRSVTAAERDAWYSEGDADKDGKDDDGIYIIDSFHDFLCFMECGKESTPKTFTYTEGGVTKQCTVELKIDIDWNYGTLEDQSFVPDVENQDKENQKTVIYKWTPYGASKASAATQTNGFGGIFEGNGHTIAGLYVSEETACVGFMAYTSENATFRNLRFKDAYVSGGNFSAVLIGQAWGTTTLENVSTNCVVDGVGCVGGLIGLTGTSSTSLLKIDNCLVSGVVTASGWRVGGFIASNRLFTTEISNSMCYADVRASKYAGGFVGIGCGPLSFTSCYFFGTVQSVDDSSCSGAFAFLERKNYTTALTQSKGTATVTLSDCYFVTDTADYALGIENARPWFNVSVSYSNDSTQKTYSGANSTDDTSLKKSAAVTALFKVVEIPEKGTGAVTIEGVQTRKNATTFDVRFVTSVVLDKLEKNDVTEIGYQISLFDDYAGAVENSMREQACTAVYQSIKSNYGMTDIKAEDYSADYLATLVVTGIPSNGIQSFVLRPYYKTELGVAYGSFALVSFYNGSVVGSEMMLPLLDTDSTLLEPITLATSFDQSTYDMRALFPEASIITVKQGETVLDSASVPLNVGVNTFDVSYVRNDIEVTISKGVSIARRAGHRVVFNTNGGSFVETQYVEDGAKVNLASVTTTRNRYTFDGWYDENGTKVDLNNASIEKDITLIARWIGPNNYAKPSTTPLIYTTSSAALNINWRDYADAFGYRPEKVYCTLTNTNTKETYSVEVTKTSARFTGAAPAGASIGQGAGLWTVKITGLVADYTFTQNDLDNENYTVVQSGTSVINTLEHYNPLHDDSTKIMTENGRFYDVAGNVVVLKGVVPWNVDQGGFEVSTGTAALERLKAEGCNVIRITVPLGPTTGYQNVTADKQERYIARMKGAVERATALGMYCIVDWGVMNQSSNNNTYLNNLLEPAQAFFGAMSTALEGNPYVIYELANEPGATWAVLKAWEENLIRYIRAIDSQAMIIAAPTMYSRRLSDDSAAQGKDPIDDPFPTEISYNVAHTFHCYAYTTTYNVDYDAAYRADAVYGWRVSDAIKNGLTVVITEFSPANASMTNEGGYDDYGLDADYMEANKWVNFILENDVNYTLFRFGERPNNANKVPAQFMFEQGNELIAYSGKWTYDMLSVSGKWYYDSLLNASGFIKAAYFNYRYDYASATPVN